MLKIIGVGMPRTGTKSLCTALQILGFKAVHFELDRLPMFPTPGIDWHRYPDVEAAVDYPEVLYWQEILTAYPKCKAILTIRDEDSWWESIEQHVNTVRANGPPEKAMQSDMIHSLLFGSPKPVSYWYRRRFREHNEAVLRYRKEHYGNGGILRLEVCDGQGWELLCPFLNVPIPPVPFPWDNRREGTT